MIPDKYILLTIDVEDWFQVENFKPYIPFSSWPERELRVEQNTHRMLDLFDSCELAEKPGRLEGGKLGANAKLDDQNKELIEPNQLNNSSESVYSSRQTTSKSHAAAPGSNKQHTTYNKPTKKIRCTFFVLGWLADRLPSLVREIQSRGHEIASHGYHHNLPDRLPAAELKMDLTDSKKRLEDLIGSPVSGYRAPSFAINDDILKIIEDCGYLYDSSYNSFGLHDRYGRISLNGCGKFGIAYELSKNFYELPLSNVMVNGRFLPLGGGAYFRLIPLALFNLGIKSILRKEDAYVFYMHPWELDPGQPRVREATLQFRFRHYTGLNRSSEKLRKLIKEFSHCGFITCSRYLKLNGGLLIV